jgi:hypothetical protein
MSLRRHTVPACRRTSSNEEATVRLRASITPTSVLLSTLAIVLIPLTAHADSLLSYQATGWRYSAATSADAPITSLFYQPTYDVSGWSTGQAAFGSGGACPLQTTVHTPWPVGTTLMVWHTFAARPNMPITVYFAVDNDAKVYVNGVQIANVTHEGCPVADEYAIAVPASMIKDCNNCVAACMMDRGGESFFDLRIDGTSCGTPVAPATWGHIKSLYR